jgi:hypothetical protein
VLDRGGWLSLGGDSGGLDGCGGRDSGGLDSCGGLGRCGAGSAVAAAPGRAMAENWTDERLEGSGLGLNVGLGLTATEATPGQTVTMAAQRGCVCGDALRAWAGRAAWHTAAAAAGPGDRPGDGVGGGGLGGLSRTNGGAAAGAGRAGAFVGCAAVVSSSAAGQRAGRFSSSSEPAGDRRAAGGPVEGRARGGCYNVFLKTWQFFSRL